MCAAYFEQRIGFERKSDATPVTVADQEAETLLRERIAAAYPHDGIVGEEFGVCEGTSGYRWIVDPIDGTKSFIAGVPLFGTIVAVEQDLRGLIGVITFPGLGLSVDAMVGQGAWETTPRGERMRAAVNTAATLGESVLLTTDWEGYAERGALERLNTVAGNAWFMRTWGDCYGHYLVATGRASAMIDPRLNLWDATALAPIVEEAGGTFTDWTGKSRIDAGEGISTNGRVLDELLALLQGPPAENP